VYLHLGLIADVVRALLGNILFSALFVRQKASMVKRYGAMFIVWLSKPFTWRVSTRWTQIPLCFIAGKSQVKQIRSDKGTNLTWFEKKLRVMI